MATARNLKVLRTILLLNIALFCRFAHAETVQWSVSEGGNGHVYEVVLVPGGITWIDANNLAEQKGGHLATITSQDENDFVFSLVNDVQYWNVSGGPLLGGYQLPGSVEPNGGWMWVTGEPFVYSNWRYDQPNNLGNENCIHFGWGSGITPTWNDLSDIYTANSMPIAYVIEYENLPEPAYAQYSGGTGEPNDPYQIATAEDLMLLGETPEDYDKHFIMTADIDLDPNLPGLKVFDRAVIAPDINDVNDGFQGTAFNGAFDGNGHTISQIMIEGDSYLGLFGQLGSGANVSNLGLEAVDVNGTGDSIGSLVGWNKGSIFTSYSIGEVSGNDTIGGFVGDNFSGTITNCYSTGSVWGDWYVGGLVGDNTGGEINCSYSTGIVAGTGERIGGLVGCNVHGVLSHIGIVTECFWDIETSGQTDSAGGTGKTTPEMQTASTFLESGWDFVDETENGTENIWWIDEGNDYPRLWWEPRFEPYQMVVSGYVDITTVYQELEGFGASVNWWEGYLTAHPLKNLIYDCLFGQLGLDIYKLRNAYEIPNGDEYIINSGEIVSAAQLSLGHPIKIMISSLTPPAYLKSNSDTAGGTLAGSARGGGYRYDMFAQWWLDSLAEYSTYGITADYISIQSNPDVQAGSEYDSCKFTPTETTDYAGYNVAFETVYQKLNSEMTIMPKMLAPETWSYYSPQEYIDALIEQNNVFGFGHLDGDFGDPDSFIQNMENFAAQYGHKPLFTMSFNNDEVSFNAAMNLAISIHNRMVYENLCSFILSDLFKGEESGGGLVTIDNPWDEFNPGYTINPVYYAFKQYSAFTDPGWHRVEISIDSDELRACAFISPDEDQLSIIIINTSEVSINLMLTLENFITENSGVYRTSENENAAYIGTFDNTEPLSLPAQSITTVNLVD